MMSNSLWQSEDPRYTFQYRLRSTTGDLITADAPDDDRVAEETTTNSIVRDDLDWRISRLDVDGD